MILIASFEWCPVHTTSLTISPVRMDTREEMAGSIVGMHRGTLHILNVNYLPLIIYTFGRHLPFFFFEMVSFYTAQASL
jgi:hypothetical protein